MQSIKQYRQLGRAVRAQYEKMGTAGGSPNGQAIRLGPPRNPNHSLEQNDELEEAARKERGDEQLADSREDLEAQSSSASSESIQPDDDFDHFLSGSALASAMTGVEARRRTTREGDKSQNVFIVGFQGQRDPLNPHNWSQARRWGAIINVALTGWIVGFASSIDSAIIPQAAKEFGVSEEVEALATALFLVTFGLGALLAGPLSEEFGRNPVYIANLVFFCIFEMASALSPNIGAQLAFRSLAGLFASSPLTCAGGSISDLFLPVERIYAFPLFANAAFLGPVFGPVVGGFIGESSITWRWCEWITLIIAGAVLASIALFQPETYGPTLLRWKAEHLREVTGDQRYVALAEVRVESLAVRMRRALYRPFLLLFGEPIVFLFGLYISVVYICLFTFLSGYTFIFQDTYGISQGLTGLGFVGIAIGILLTSPLIPLIMKWYKDALRKAEAASKDGKARLPPEERLWFAMIGAPTVPISLFWMGWTAYPDIPIWSPLAAGILFGFGILCIFISCNQYLIDSYELFAASALASIAVVRYVASGGLVAASIPIYTDLNVHWTLTLLGCLTTALLPVPYLFYHFGARIRKWSKYAVTES